METSLTHDADDDDVPKLLEIPLARKSDKKMTYRWMKNRTDSKLFEKIPSDTNDKEKSLENVDSKKLPKHFHWCAAHRLGVIMRSNPKT